jgi:predicted DNA-binding transcriptional regulator YafY
MKELFKQMELLGRIHKGIKNAHTGTPAEFSAALGISRRRLYDIIEEMASRGAPIEYSRHGQTYSYSRDFEIVAVCEFRNL